jgi:hypothetical protein
MEEHPDDLPDQDKLPEEPVNLFMPWRWTLGDWVAYGGLLTILFALACFYSFLLWQTMRSWK